MVKAFDVFLSHNSKDKPAVRELAAALRARGLRVWLDEDHLVPGRPWQKALEEIIQTTQSAAVLIGKDGLGPWEEPEMRGCLSECVDRKLPVIPVLLPDAPKKPELPLFLKAYTWVDLRGGLTAEGVDKLVWGITGVKPSPTADAGCAGRSEAHRSRWMRFVPQRILHRLMGGLAVLAVLGGIVVFFLPPPTALHPALESARHSMAIGRYPEAMRHYQAAIGQDADNREAVFGAKKAQLAEKITHAAHDDPAGFGADLKALQQAATHDADLLMLEGDLLARDPLPERRDLAAQKYEEALRENPNLAEAHFRLGVLSTRAGDKNSAIQHYQAAVNAAGIGTPEHYKGNLAELYLWRGDYAEAIRIYESLDEYPLAGLEAAKAHWALGELKQALEGQTRALRWLENPEVSALPKNQTRWRLGLSPDDAAISVATPACKHYYATLSQAASRFLLEGQETVPAAGDCADGDKIRQAVAEDLRRYALIQPGQAQAGQAFVARLLAPL